MPETLHTTPALTIAEHLLDMAHAIDQRGLWTNGPAFVDTATGRLDVPAAAHQAATGYQPFVFTVPTPEAADIARAHIEVTPAAMDTLRAIADHLATTWPDLDWTSDPIEALAGWPHLLGVTPDQIPATLRTLAHHLTLTATTAVAA